MKRLARILLISASPIQHFIDKPCHTHTFCNRQALRILKNAHSQECFDFFKKYGKDLDAGTQWADKDWKNVDHYLEPDTRKGIWPFGNALDTCLQYFERATKLARYGNLRKAAFFLGAAAHLVQDLCVPHHARGRMFNGHQEFETWARTNHSTYAVNVYDKDSDIITPATPAELIIYNASVACDFFEQVNIDGPGIDYSLASAVLLPLAQRSTAILMERFHLVALRSGADLGGSSLALQVTVA